MSGHEGHQQLKLETIEDVQKHVKTAVMPRLKRGWHLDSTTEKMADSKTSEQEVIGKIWEKVEQGGMKGEAEELIMRPALTAG